MVVVFLFPSTPLKLSTIKQLVRNLQAQNYRLHLFVLTDYEVMRQFYSHILLLVDPISPPSQTYQPILPFNQMKLTIVYQGMVTYSIGLPIFICQHLVCLWWRRWVLPPSPIQPSIRINKLYLIYIIQNIISQYLFSYLIPYLN